MELNIGSIYGLSIRLNLRASCASEKPESLITLPHGKTVCDEKGTSAPGDREIASRNGGKYRNGDCITGQAAQPHGTGQEDHSDQGKCCHIRHGRE